MRAVLALEAGVRGMPGPRNAESLAASPRNNSAKIAGVVAGLLVALTCGGTAASANDATAIPPALELPAGGLVFTSRERLSVEEETLVIALDRIEIASRIRNLTSAPHTFMMAFQMPTIDMSNLYGQSFAIPAFDPQNPTNFVGFWTTIDGIPVEPDVDVRAYAVGQADVTALLKKADVPLYPLAPGMSDRLASLPPEKRKEFEDADLIDGDSRALQALWTLRTVFHWRQAISPDAIMSVRHHYRPVLGSAPWSPELKEKAISKYCLGAEDLERLDKLLADGKPPTIYWAHYATAHNAWLKGPSAAHTLEIERPSGLAIAATCAPGERSDVDDKLRITSSNRIDDSEIFVLFAE